MALRKFDDETGTEIPLAGGIELTILLTTGLKKVLYFTGWKGVPKRYMDGTVAGDAVASIQIRDLDAVPAHAPVVDPMQLRARRVGASTL